MEPRGGEYLSDDEDELPPPLGLQESVDSFHALLQYSSIATERQRFLRSMESTYLAFSKLVRDADSEADFLGVAHLTLLGHLFNTLQVSDSNALLSSMGTALNAIDEVFLKPETVVVDIDLATMIVTHLRSRQYPRPAQQRRLGRSQRYEIDKSVYPLLACVVAHTVALHHDSPSWEWVLQTTHRCLAESFRMNRHVIQAGVALFGLQVIKSRNMLVKEFGIMKLVKLLKQNG